MRNAEYLPDAPSTRIIPVDAASGTLESQRVEICSVSTSAAASTLCSSSLGYVRAPDSEQHGIFKVVKSCTYRGICGEIPRRLET